MCFGLLFPGCCVGCRRPGESLCKICYKEILPLTCQYCPVCGEESVLGKVCCGCAGNHDDLYGLLVGAEFCPGSLLQRLLHSFKYKHHPELAGPLVTRLFSEDALWEVAQIVDICVPVPLHSQRLRERGWNQAERLAEEIAGKQGLVHDATLLCRERETKSQAHLHRSERYANVQDAFVTRGPSPPHVLLVDDVATTLATLESCARALKEAGAKVVYAVVLARSRQRQ